MQIRCWGSRGSIPVSGQQYERYGGDTTCVEIRARSGDLVIVDAGTGIRALGNRLMQEKVKKFEMLFTHAHWDHILGFPFFAPVFQKGVDVHIRGCAFELGSFREVLKRFMSAPLFPVGLEVLRARIKYGLINSRSFSIGSLKIKPISLSHPNGGVGFRIEEDGRSFVFLTDNELDYLHAGGLSFKEYASLCQDADLLIHDAEFTRKDYKLYRLFGHSQYTDATRLAIESRVRRFGMFHLNKERTDNQVDEMVADARKIVTRQNAAVDVFAVGNSFEITL